MIKVFKGAWRGIGQQKDNIGMIFSFRFRDYMHHFKGVKLAVFIALCLHADENGVCYPSYSRLEKETGYYREAVSKAIQQLCEMEIEGHRILIKWRERDEIGKYTGSNRYRIFPTQKEIEELLGSKIELPQDEAQSSKIELGGSAEIEPGDSSKIEPEVKPLQEKPFKEKPNTLLTPSVSTNPGNGNTHPEGKSVRCYLPRRWRGGWRRGKEPRLQNGVTPPAP